VERLSGVWARVEEGSGKKSGNYDYPTRADAVALADGRLCAEVPLSLHVPVLRLVIAPLSLSSSSARFAVLRSLLQPPSTVAACDDGQPAPPRARAQVSRDGQDDCDDSREGRVGKPSQRGGAQVRRCGLLVVFIPGRGRARTTLVRLPSVAAGRASLLHENRCGEGS
jgi:hypothetical protein